MKKNVIVCGLISGLIVSTIMTISMSMYHDNTDYGGSMALGYASMLLAFSLVFVGIKTARDKYNQGMISFGKAFLTGLYITLIASTMYVISWVIMYHTVMPDFMDKYAEHVLEASKAKGDSAAELEKQAKDMEYYKEMYKNPIFVVLMTYLEILPVGLLVTLICALILKRKHKQTDIPVA